MNPYFKAIPAGEVQEPLETQKVWTVPACRASATRHVFCFTLCPLPHIEQIKSSSWREKHSCTGTEERARVWAILPPRGCWPSSHSPSSTHCPHSAAIWPAGKSEPPETRPNTWCSLTTRAFLLIVKGWIKIIQAHKVHGRTTFKKKKKSYSFYYCEVRQTSWKMLEEMWYNTHEQDLVLWKRQKHTYHMTKSISTPSDNTDHLLKPRHTALFLMWQSWFNPL